MVKMFSIKANHLKILAMMITMTFNTFFPFNFCGCMIASSSSYSNPNLQVTLKTFFIGNFLTKGMAFGTV